MYHYFAKVTGGDLTRIPLDPPFLTGPYKTQEAALHNAASEIDRATELGISAKIEVTRVNQSSGKNGGSLRRLFLFSCHPEPSIEA